MKPFKLVSVQDGMPKSDESVLIFVRGDWRLAQAGWTVGYFNGNRWIYDVPAEVFSHVERYTGHSIPMGEDLVSPDLNAVITHWAALPSTPEDDAVLKMSNLKVQPTPIVEEDSQSSTLDIYGEPSPYRKGDPYSIDLQKVKGPREALLVLAHVATRPWARSEKLLRYLANRLADWLSGDRSVVN